MNKSRRFLMCFFWTLLSLTALRLPARADCLIGFNVMHGMQSGPHADSNALGLEGVCPLDVRLQINQIGNHIGLSTSMGLLIPFGLKRFLKNGSVRWIPYLQAGPGYHFGGGGLHGFGYAGGGVFWHWEKNEFVQLDFTQRFRFRTTRTNAGWQIGIGLVWIVQD